jgi:pectate lyase-like protein/parallel beta helix pectate lyase-like protein
VITLAAAGTLQGVSTNATTVTYSLFGLELAGTTDVTAGTVKPLAQGQLPASAGVLYTVPVGQAAVVKKITLSNTGGTAQTVTLFVNGSGATNEVTSFVIPANGSAVFERDLSLYDQFGNLQAGMVTGYALDSAVVHLAGAETITGAKQFNANAPVRGPIPWCDIVAFGADPTGVADSTAAFNAALVAAATNGTVYCPPGSFSFLSAPNAIPGFVKVQGAGQYQTRLVPKFTTGDFLTLGGGCSVEDLWIIGPSNFTAAGGTLSGTPQTVNVAYATTDFPTSGSTWISLTNGTWGAFTWTGKGATSFTGVTGSGVFSASAFITGRGSGAAIATGANSLIEINKVSCYYMYDGFAAGGVATTVSDCLIRNTVRYGIYANIDDGSPFLHNVFMDNDYAQSTSGLQLTQGAAVMSNVQIMRHDIGMNCPVAAGGLFSTFGANCFFDNCRTAGLSITGPGTPNVFDRGKFVQSWFGSSTNGVVLNNTGIRGIDFDHCDFYLNSANGLQLLAATEVGLNYCRFANNTTAGINAPVTGGSPDVAIMNCLVGPILGALTGNGAGIILSGTLSNLRIDGNNLAGNTGAALTDTSTVANPNQKMIANNSGLSVAPLPYVISATIGATETIPTGGQVYLPAGSPLVGTTFKIIAHGIMTATSPTILPRIRLGTLGTPGDTQVCATGATVITTGTGWQVIGYVTIRTIGAGGTAIGNLVLDCSTPARTAQTATVAINTTVANYLSFSLVGAGTTPVITPTNVHWEVVRQ